MLDRQHSFLEAAGRRLEYQLIAGQKAGCPTLVFLHEGLGSASMWRDFPQALASATGCAALVYSRYGYGQSESLQVARQVDYMHREALDSLPEVLAQLEIERPILVGQSDGASIALIYAGAGHSVAALILEAPHVFVEAVTVSSIAAIKQVFQDSDLVHRLGRHHADPSTTFWGWNDIWLHPDFRAWNIESYLPAVDCPILMIQGKDDEYGSWTQIEAIERQASGPTDSLALERCGHAPHRDRREATLEAMTKFVLNQLDGE